MREEEGLYPLTIISVPHELSENGEIISSSRIREGEIDREGKSWFNYQMIESDLYLTKEVESMLKDPFGKLFEGPEDDHSVSYQGCIK